MRLPKNPPSLWTLVLFVVLLGVASQWKRQAAGSGHLDTLTIWIVILLTVVGWQLGKAVWSTYRRRRG